MRRSVDLETWDVDAALPLPDGAATKLFKARRVGAAVILYAATKRGLYAHDEVLRRFVDSGFNVPFDSEAGLGVDVWREIIYYGDGLGIYGYDSAGLSGGVVSAKGPDRDDGLPYRNRGHITSLLGTHTELIVFIDARELDVAPFLRASHGGSGLRPNILGGREGVSSILAWNGSRYQPLWTTTGDKALVRRPLASSVGMDYRLWWAAGNELYWTKRSRDIPNANEVETEEFAEEGELITPWFDASDIAVEKVALQLVVEASRITDTETATVQVGFDREPGWHDLGEITKNGTTRFPFPARYGDTGDVGAQFEAVRFRIAMQRGADVTKSPDIHVYQMAFYRQLDQKYTYSLTIDMSKEIYGLTPQQQWNEIRRMSEQAHLVPFAYRGKHDDRTHYVKVVSDSQNLETGDRMMGEVTLELLEL